MYKGNAKGFGQRFDPPEPSQYLRPPYGFCKDYQLIKIITLALIRNHIKENSININSTMPKDIHLQEGI